MSHGSTDKCEPNFTPLLDLVLQLVMFFMLCANFVMEQTAVEIKLKNYMKRQADREKARTGKDKPQSVLILRVDKNTYFEKTYEIMRACRQAGFEKVQLR